MGPLVLNSDVTERAKHSDGEGDMQAIIQLGLRHLPENVVLDLLAPLKLH